LPAHESASNEPLKLIRAGLFGLVTSSRVISATVIVPDFTSQPLPLTETLSRPAAAFGPTTSVCGFEITTLALVWLPPMGGLLAVMYNRSG
jgi:hypothetical protein